jgi:hypothetical protein
VSNKLFVFLAAVLSGCAVFLLDYQKISLAAIDVRLQWLGVGMA